MRSGEIELGLGKSRDSGHELDKDDWVAETSGNGVISQGCYNPAHPSIT